MVAQDDVQQRIPQNPSIGSGQPWQGFRVMPDAAWREAFAEMGQILYCAPKDWKRVHRVAEPCTSPFSDNPSQQIDTITLTFIMWTIYFPSVADASSSLTCWVRSSEVFAALSLSLASGSTEGASTWEYPTSCSPESCPRFPQHSPFIKRKTGRFGS